MAKENSISSVRCSALVEIPGIRMKIKTKDRSAFHIVLTTVLKISWFAIFAQAENDDTETVLAF